ncbi:transposase [uncultured Allofournierella sp.]|uniref:transposase n=1 Tax=uncultured Allofournierella sp. TaxID=1940258 RepID=UPI003750F5B9
MYDLAESQLTLYDYVQPFGGALDESNRWVRLAKAIDWQELERQYAHHFGRAGNQALPLRVAFGSLVIRQALELSDKQTVQMIRESPYLQYFIGMTSFEYQLPFVAHSMVGFRQRIPAQQIGQAVQMWKKFSREDMARKR